MAENKKYYWLKLKRDFFKRHDIRIIESMPNGKDYILFYLKLLLESIDHEGHLRFSDSIPYNEQMLSVITNTNIDTVRSAMDIFIGLEMIEIQDDKTIFMAEVDKLIGGETKWAEYKRKSVKKKDDVPLLENFQTNSKDVPIEIEEDIETDKDTEFRERETERNNDSPGHSFTITEGNSVENSRKQIKTLFGSIGQGVVMLSDEQMDDLLDRLSKEEFDHYVSAVAECELSGKKYKKKTHYQAILDMAKKDRGIKRS